MVAQAVVATLEKEVEDLQVVADLELMEFTEEGMDQLAIADIVEGMEIQEILATLVIQEEMGELVKMDL